MIITKIRLQEQTPMTDGTKTWPLPPCDLFVNSFAGRNGYILVGSAGIGPPYFTDVVEGFDKNGVPVLDAKPDKRDISFKIGFNPAADQSVQQLRSDLYKFISKSLIISFMNESETIAQITGHISRFDPSHFSNPPEVRLVIRCHTSDFSAPYAVDIPLATLNTLTPNISYVEGDAPTGLNLTFKYTAVADGTGFTISNYGKFWGNVDPGVAIENEFVVTYTLVTDDEVTISTHPGIRRITLLRDGDTIDITGYINAGAVWPKLYHGVNVFTWTFADTWMEWLSASYIPKYWGV